MAGQLFQAILTSLVFFATQLFLQGRALKL